MSTIQIEFWIVFNIIIFGMLFVDLKFVQKEAHAMSVKEAAGWSAFWVSLALCFCAGIYYFMGTEKAMKFLTGYVIEESLSVDNLFVFLMIFQYFNVPDKYQPRILHWGILGAIVMRLVLIFTGIAILQAFHWVVYIFGGLLIITGIRTAFGEDKKLDPGKNPVIRIFKKVMPIAEPEGGRFFVRLNNVLHATPLFIVLLVVESSDLVFAMDSIPAILAVTTDRFLVYTSNIFAILGLRAMYFLLSAVMPLFTYLKFGISIVLCYVGVKMLIVNFYSIPTGLSLAVVVGILAVSILASVIFKPKPGA